MATYVDLQFFKISNLYIVKEFATLRDDCRLSHYIFESPKDYTLLPRSQQLQVEWIQNNHHSIPWTAGNIPYERASRVIIEDLQDSRIIFVKGIDKVRFLKSLNITAVNIENLGIRFKIRNIARGISCLNHKNNNNNLCALNIIFTIKTYVEYKKLNQI